MAEPLSNQEIQEEVASQEIQEQSPRGESQEQTHSQEIQEEIPSRKIHVDVVTANRQEKVLLLHQARFNQRDIEIFQSILEGNKYEYIAGEQGISLSSVKKRVRFLLNHLNLPDKASFVFTYTGYIIRLGVSMSEIEAVNNIIQFPESRTGGE